MAKGSQQKNKKNQKDYESKEQRRARLQAQKEAQEACQKALPKVGAFIFLLLVGFALYVRSVPPKVASNTPLSPEELAQFDIPKDGASAAADKVEEAKVDTIPEVSSLIEEDEGETVEL
mmetsp:Transcript_26520/g.37380  ORF Transcript_26520/g.37380 Transcript_26520/m.37380 type:complete len:119 (-) Transcript_26520:169-525(-)